MERTVTTPNVDDWLSLLEQGRSLRWFDRTAQSPRPAGRIVFEVRAVGRFYWAGVERQNTLIEQAWLVARTEPERLRQLLRERTGTGELEIAAPWPQSLVDPFTDASHGFVLSIPGISIGIEEETLLRLLPDGRVGVTTETRVLDGMSAVSSEDSTLTEPEALQLVHTLVAKGMVPVVRRLA